MQQSTGSVQDCTASRVCSGYRKEVIQDVEYGEVVLNLTCDMVEHQFGRCRRTYSNDVVIFFDRENK